MITSAIVYAIIGAVFFSAAALAAEHAARVLRRQTRWVWFATIVASLVWPVIGMVIPKLGPARPALEPVMIGVQRVTAAAAAAPSRFITVDRVIVALWVITSLFLLVRLALGLRRIHQKRTSWEHGSIDGVPVRLSDAAGPAVVGLRTMDVIMPTWLQSLDPRLRAMVLTHESEHRAARDPILLFIAGLAVALTPWNLAMWWQTRRLRLAIEVDCDARVLRRHDDSERYGMLLLTIAQRGGLAMSFATMLSEPVSQLEQRIDAMHPPAYRRPMVRAAVALACGIVAFIAACAVASPDRTLGPSATVQPRSVASSQPYFEFQVEKAVQVAPGNGAPRYPDVLRSANQEGEVLAQFVVRPDGRADMSTFRALKSTHQLFTTSVSQWLPGARFTPALVGGKAVSQVVQMPFQFNLSHDVMPGTPTPPTLDQIRVARSQKSAAILPNQGAPKYPTELRERNVRGEVLAQFIVNADGRPDLASFKVTRSEDPLFTESVKAWLAGARFSPAEVDGKKVKQLMQMPFAFSLAP